MDGRPLVSVLVVTFNHADEIASCLDAALRQRSDAHDLEVIVVDNASTDGTPDVVGAYGDHVKLVALGRNTGYAGGVNTAFEHATGEVIVLLNPDCVMDDGCVDALWRHLAATPGVGVAAALLRYPDGTPQLFARRELTMKTVLWCFTELGRRLDRRRGGRALADRRYEPEFAGGVREPLVVDCPAAACIATWRALVEPRPLDPAYPLVFNDADLYRRLRAQSYRCEIVPSACAAHAYGTSLRRVAQPRMRAEFVRSILRYQQPVWGPVRGAALWTVLAADAATSVLLRARTNARGTLGGLGLPGGDAPWLIEVPAPRARVRRAVRRCVPDPRRVLASSSRRLRRRWFITRLRTAAWLARAHVTLDVHPSADLPRDAVFEVRPRSRSRVVIGRDVQIQPGLVLRLAGSLELGPQSQLRYGVSINVKGRIVFEGRDIVGRGGTIHAHGDMRWGWGSVVGEYVSVIDSNHEVDGTPVHPFDQPVGQADIALGACVFVGAHSTVTAGVSIGQGTTVGAGSVVSRSLGPGVIAVGAPAEPIRLQPAAWSAVARPAQDRESAPAVTLRWS